MKLSQKLTNTLMEAWLHLP